MMKGDVNYMDWAWAEPDGDWDRWQVIGLPVEWGPKYRAETYRWRYVSANLGLSVEQTAEAMEATYGLTARVDGDTIYLGE